MKFVICDFFRKYVIRNLFVSPGGSPPGVEVRNTNGTVYNAFPLSTNTTFSKPVIFTPSATPTPGRVYPYYEANPDALNVYTYTLGAIPGISITGPSAIYNYTTTSFDMECSYILSNPTSDNITVTGLAMQYGLASNNNFLMWFSVFDEQLVIAPGENKTVTVHFKQNYEDIDP